MGNVIAAVITAITILIVGFGITKSISNHELTRSLIPELTSDNPYKIKLALIIEKDVDQDRYKDFVAIVSDKYTDIVPSHLKSGDVSAAEKDMADAGKIDKSVYDNVKKRLSDYTNDETIKKNAKAVDFIKEGSRCYNYVLLNTDTSSGTYQEYLPIKNPECKE